MPIHAPSDSGRRGFMRGFGVAAAGAAAATALGGNGLGVGRAAAATNLDIPILQFALNLEYLEAEFYLRAATGSGLGPAVTGNPSSTVVGGSQVPFTSSLISAYAQEIAQEERKHVLFLRAALGSNAINEPAIDLKNSFITLGNATGLSTDFNPFADDFSFMLAAYIFEDVGVTAYHGAATLITNPAYLDAAAGILAVEAYHAGLIRTVLFANGYSQQTQAISMLRANLDGTLGTPNIDDQGVGTTQLPHIVLASDPRNAGGSIGNNAIAYDRSPRQVANIVYGGVNAAKGLFFPNGINGAGALFS
jgi:hypothetical protein